MFVAVIGFVPCMGNQRQDDDAGHPDRMPPRFAIFDAIQPPHVQPVVDNELGDREADTMLAPVGFVLRVIPDE